MHSARDMTEADPRVFEGIGLLRARKWYAAHEAIETSWLEATGERRKLLQGLIHVAVSFEHLRRGNPRGALSQWRKAQPALGVLGRHHCGVDIEAWRAEIESFFGRIDLEGRVEGSGADQPLPDEATWPVPPAS